MIAQAKENEGLAARSHVTGANVKMKRLSLKYNECYCYGKRLSEMCGLVPICL